jgi:hypothetical protein
MKILHLVFCSWAIILLACSSSTTERNTKFDSSNRLFEPDYKMVAQFVSANFRLPGPVFSGIPPAKNVVVVVGIKDGPCKANGGDIIFMAYKKENIGEFWDAILRFEKGRITKILKVNETNIMDPKEMIEKLLEPNCK